MNNLFVSILFSRELSGYYLIVGIVGLLVLAFEIWLVIVDLKMIGSLQKTICQLRKQLHQSHNLNECSHDSPLPTVSTSSPQRALSDQDNKHP
jgi:hypothetical protein